jgi:hypothetical protein
MQKPLDFFKFNFVHLINLVKKKRFWILSLFVLLTTAIFVIDTFHESYPDEFDNISGGWLILHGTLIYKSFFTHHGPFPYFLSSFLEIFSGQSFVRFRIVYAIFLVLINIAFFVFLRAKFKEKIADYYPLFIVFLGIESTYYWAQMLLADNIAAYSFLFIYILLLLKVFYKKALSLWDLAFASIVGAIGLYSSLTFTYLYAIFMLAYFVVYLQQKTMGFNKKSLVQIGKCLIIFAAPHIVYLVYLFITQSFQDYYFQNIVFNTKYYIYNYPRPNGSSSINPIRYAIVIANNYFNNIYPLFMQIKDFNLFNPFNVTMVLGNISLFSYLLLKKHYKLVLFTLIVLVFSTVRNNPSASRETDYQSAVYIFISFFNIFFLLPNLYEDINNSEEIAKKVIFSVLLIVVLIYSFGSVFGFMESFSNRFFAKYMGTAPLIYDRPKVAPIMNSILEKNDYTWVGPFNFEDDFYINAIPASRYHILIPGLAKSSETRDQLINDLKKTNPKAIWFNKHTFILGSSVEQYGKFLTDYLNKNYITIQDYKKGKVQYVSVAPATIDVDIETSLFLRRDYAPQAIEKLVHAGFLRIK